MKKKYKIRWKAVVILFIIFNCLIFGIKDNYKTPKQDKVVETHKKEKKPVKEEVQYELDDIKEEPIIEEQPIVEEPSDTYTTRMTSFWANDGYGTGECTGSGLCSWDFGINENGWYTYDGKLVIATGTTYLANQGWYVADGIRLYKYWQELVVTIDGVDYDSIILDSCGACMRDNRIDLFVSNGSSARDTMVEVKIK